MFSLLFPKPHPGSFCRQQSHHCAQGIACLRLVYVVSTLGTIFIPKWQVLVYLCTAEGRSSLPLLRAAPPQVGWQCRYCNRAPLLPSAIRWIEVFHIVRINCLRKTIAPCCRCPGNDPVGTAYIGISFGYLSIVSSTGMLVVSPIWSFTSGTLVRVEAAHNTAKYVPHRLFVPLSRSQLTSNPQA